MSILSGAYWSINLHAIFLAGLFLGSANTVRAHPDACYVTTKLDHFRLKTYIGDRKCVAFDPPRTISGIWINEFEGSLFYEKVKRLDDVKLNDTKVWLTIDDETLMSAELRGRGFGRAYRIKFIGRTATDMNKKPSLGYGHFGMSSGPVLVDRIIDWEDIGQGDPRRR